MQLPPFGMLPPSDPQSGDCEGSTSADDDALAPGVTRPLLTMPW